MYVRTKAATLYSPSDDRGGDLSWQKITARTGVDAIVTTPNLDAQHTSRQPTIWDLGICRKW